MHFDLASSRLMKTLTRLASVIGIGFVCIYDEDYEALVEAHKKLTGAFRRGDLATASSLLTRSYRLERPDGLALTRSEYEEQLRHRFASQLHSDYREEPAHFVIRGNRATIASRTFGKSLCRRDGKLIELEERSESISKWVKVGGVWKRAGTKIRVYEQNMEWVLEPAESQIAAPKSVKYLA